MNNKLHVAFIGAGSMAEAIISGLISTEQLSCQNISVTNRANDERLNTLQDSYGVITTRDRKTLVEQSNVLVLAMKPKDVTAGIEQIKPYINENHLIVSLLAGVSTDSLVSLIEKPVPVIRAMPNTSASIGLSATGIAKGKFANAEHLEIAEALFKSIGMVVTVDQEEELHAVTGLSGSGPAYIYYIVEAMEKAAMEKGLEKETAKALIIQTLIGAAEMLRTSPKTPAILRKEITSEGGTTEAGLKQLASYDCQEAFIECIKHATERSKELGASIEYAMSANRS